MADFDKAVAKVLKHEGGYSNHPADPGGETNRGLTDRLDGKVDGMIDVDGDGDGDISVKGLTEEQAKQVYKTRFWDRMQGDLIKSQPVAEIIFDAYVNTGVNGLKMLQREIGVVADGIFGPNTIAVLNRAAPKVVFEGFKDARVQFYNSLATRKPELKVFLKGWLNRVNSFKYDNSI